MGTHIESYFPRAVEPTLGAVLAQLSQVFTQLEPDLAAIRQRGGFSQGTAPWSLFQTDTGIDGEGPCGFSILVFPQVVEFTSIERFGTLESREHGIHESLRRVFEVVAASLGSSGEFAVAAGGFGDTDHACALAADGASFGEVRDRLEARLGPPARSWRELETGPGLWLLRGPTLSTES